MTTLLFTGGGGAGMQAIWHLWKGTYDLYFADADPSAIHPDIPRERTISAPPGGGLPDKPLHKRVDLIVPTIDEELPRFAPLGNALVPDEAFVRMCLNKVTCMDRLRAAGYNVPKTFRRKPAVGRGSRGQELFQEEVYGQEYTVTVSATRAGELAGVVPIRVYAKRGVTLRASGINDLSDDQIIVETCTQLHGDFWTRGVYNVQGIVQDGRFVIFEINPRISTTFPLVIAIGLDPVAQFLADAPIPWTPTFKYLQRYWHNVIQ